MPSGLAELFANEEEKVLTRAKNNSQYAQARASSASGNEMRSRSIALKRHEAYELMLKHRRIWIKPAIFKSVANCHEVAKCH